MRGFIAGLAAVLLLQAAVQTESAAGDVCGQTYNATHGTIDSKDIKDPGAGKNCTWFVMGPEATEQGSNKIALDFSSLDFAPGTDTLTIYAGNDSDSAQVTTFSSHQDGVPEMVISPGQLVKMVFARGDQSVTAASFKLSFNTENCSRSVSASGSDIIRSPIYLNGTAAFECTYTVSLPGPVPLLTFWDFNLPAGNLRVQFNKTDKANLTGTSQPDDILGKGTEVQTFDLILSIQNDSRAQGFYVIYYSVSADCSGVINPTTTTLTNLTLPSTPHPVRCYWRLTAKDNGSHVYMVPSIGQLADRDYIQFYDGGSSVLNRIGERYDGVPWYVSSGQTMTVMATLDSYTSRTSQLQYKQDKFSRLYPLISKGTPSQTITLKGSEVSGQNVSLQFLADNTTSQVRVDVATGTKLSTNTTVKIQDGRGNVVMTFGKDSQLFPIRVADSRALVVITNLKGTDVVSLTAAVDSGDDCNQLYTGDTGQITAISSAKQNRTCTVALTTAKATLLTITSLNLCDSQSVEIYAGLSMNATKVATLSGKMDTLSTIQFPANSAPRLTWTDKQNATGCGIPMLRAVFSPQDTVGACGTVDPAASSGVLSSPDWPNYYPLNVDCAWSVPSKNETTLYLSFSNIRLAEKHSLTVKNGAKDIAVFNATTSTQQNDLVLKNKDISLAFSSAVTQTNRLESTLSGFQVTYNVLTCGGYLDVASETISSPKGVNSSTECVKVAPDGEKKSVNVVFVNITTEGYVNTSSGVLELNDMGSFAQGYLPNVNLSTGNVSYYSRHNIMLVRYRYNASMPGAKPFSFSLKYSTHSCNSSQQCKNGDCMLPGWHCDGVVQCPDGSDELNCNAPPTSPSPTPAPKTAPKTGVASYWVVICLLIGLGLGIVVMIFVPKMIRRWRLRSYTGGASNYGTLSEDA